MLKSLVNLMYKFAWAHGPIEQCVGQGNQLRRWMTCHLSCPENLVLEQACLVSDTRSTSTFRILY